MPAIEAEILFDAPLERAVGNDVLPVIQHGNGVSGHVVLRGSDTFNGLSLVVAQRTVDANGDTRVQFSSEEPHVLLTDETHAAPGSDGMRVKFVLPADALLRVPTYVSCGNKDPVSIQNSLVARVNSRGFLGRCVSNDFPQRFDLQCLEPAPPASLPMAKRAWMTVGDFGGTCKLELSTGPTLDLIGELSATLTASGTAPLKIITLKLLEFEDEGPPSLLHEWTLWVRRVLHVATEACLQRV